MERRTLLTTCLSGLVFGLSGCVTSNAGSGKTSTTDQPTGTPDNATPTEPLPDGVAVDRIAVRKATFSRRDLGRDTVHANDGEQHVIASVRAENGVSAQEFALETDDDTWDPAPVAEYRGRGSVAGRSERRINPEPAESRWTLVFDVLAPLSATDPRITYTGSDGTPGDGQTWPIPAEVRERLTAPAPVFELVELDAPNSVEYGETLSVPITVRNTAETDGRFLALVVFPTKTADDDESHEMSTHVPAGETATVTYELETEDKRIESNPVTLEVRGHVTADPRIEVNGYS